MLHWSRRSAVVWKRPDEGSIPSDSMTAIVTCDLSVHEGFLDYKSKPDFGHTQHHESVRVFGMQGLLSVEGIPQNARSKSHEIINWQK